MSVSQHIWFEKLTLIKFFWIFTKKKNKKIFYLSSSLLVKILIKLFSLDIKHVQLEAGILDKNGKALRYKIEKANYHYVLKIYHFLSLDNYLPDVVKLFKDEWRRILKSDLDYLIKKKLTNIYVIKERYNNDFLYRDLEISYVGETFRYHKVFYQLLNEDIKILNFKIFSDFFSWPKRIIYFLKFFGSVYYSFVYKFFRSDYYNFENKFHIFEEHIYSIFDRYPHAGHLFWFEDSKIDPSDLVLYFDRSDQRINANIIKEINTRQMNTLNMRHPVINVKNPFKVLIQTFKDVHKFKSFSYQEIDIWLTQINYIFLINCFREVFRKYKCKIIHQHQEFWPKTLVLALAIRMEKGVFIWNHWSIDRFPVSYFHWGFADILFSWGEHNDGYFNCHDFSYKYLFQTGLIAADGNYRGEISGYKYQFPKDLSLVVNILDSTYGSTSQNSYESMKYFYKEMLSMIYNNKNWGAVVKSKGKTFEDIIKNKQIKNYVNLLKNENRIIILAPDEKVSTSAKISDISVSYGINSAGVIAALSGSKSIYWDLNGNIEHPLYYLKKKNFLIFKSVIKIEEALKQFIKGDQNIGNHKDYLHLFDTYCDDNGRKRAGQIISRLFSNFKSNLELQDNLNQIKKEFQNKWGKKTVYEYRSGDNHKGNQLWQQVQENLKKTDEIK